LNQLPSIARFLHVLRATIGGICTALDCGAGE